MESYSPTLDLHNLYGEYTLTYDMGGNTGVSGVCWINEVLTNPNGSDSTASTGNEHFELRGTPGMSLSGYYMLSVEGGNPAGSTKGDINQFFDLGAFSIGENGYLFARQNLSLYTATATGATVIQNTAGQGWGQTGSTVGYSGDGTQVDLENGTTTIMLINIGSGIAPELAMDLDADDDGVLDTLPDGWSIVDSVGIIDGADPQAATDRSYGAITLRVGGAAAGSSQYGNIVDVPGAPTTTAGAFYVGRVGDSTGSTSADWFGAILNGTSGDPLNITFASTSNPYYQGMKLPDMVLGGANPAPILGDANRDGVVDDGDASIVGGELAGALRRHLGRRRLQRRRQGQRPRRRHPGRPLGSNQRGRGGGPRALHAHAAGGPGVARGSSAGDESPTRPTRRTATARPSTARARRRGRTAIYRCGGLE